MCEEFQCLPSQRRMAVSGLTFGAAWRTRRVVRSGTPATTRMPSLVACLLCSASRAQRRFQPEPRCRFVAHFVGSKGAARSAVSDLQSGSTRNGKEETVLRRRMQRRFAQPGMAITCLFQPVVRSGVRDAASSQFRTFVPWGIAGRALDTDRRSYFRHSRRRTQSCDRPQLLSSFDTAPRT